MIYLIEAIKALAIFGSLGLVWASLNIIFGGY
jgi:hypothetical protein